ncbi:MAG: hypothetical protein WA347_05935 [Rhabdochlamydiaceae bacterium]|jgi:hypothetical protein
MATQVQQIEFHTFHGNVSALRQSNLTTPPRLLQLPIDVLPIIVKHLAKISKPTEEDCIEAGKNIINFGIICKLSHLVTHDPNIQYQIGLIKCLRHLYVTTRPKFTSLEELRNRMFPITQLSRAT